MSRERYRHRHNTRTSMEWRDHESHILKFDKICWAILVEISSKYDEVLQETYRNHTAYYKDTPLFDSFSVGQSDEQGLGLLALWNTHHSSCKSWGLRFNFRPENIPSLATSQDRIVSRPKSACSNELFPAPVAPTTPTKAPLGTSHCGWRMQRYRKISGNFKACRYTKELHGLNMTRERNSKPVFGCKQSGSSHWSRRIFATSQAWHMTFYLRSDLTLNISSCKVKAPPREVGRSGENNMEKIHVWCQSRNVLHNSACLHPSRLPGISMAHGIESIRQKLGRFWSVFHTSNYHKHSLNMLKP